jgi:hypothetical protein
VVVVCAQSYVITAQWITGFFRVICQLQIDLFASSWPLELTLSINEKDTCRYLPL